MKITAKLFAGLRSYAPPGTDGHVFEQDIGSGRTVGDLLAQWHVPEATILLIFVNAAHAGKDHVLADGDILAVFPLVGGG